MLLVCIWQRSTELACVRVELLEEGDVHPGIPVMEDVREIPAACAESNQLSPRLRLALGNHDDLFLSALTGSKRVFITNVKGTFLGMSESEEASKRR